MSDDLTTILPQGPPTGADSYFVHNVGRMIYNASCDDPQWWYYAAREIERFLRDNPTQLDSIVPKEATATDDAILAAFVADGYEGEDSRIDYFGGWRGCEDRRRVTEQSLTPALAYDEEKKRNAHTMIIIGLAGLLRMDLGPDPKTKKEQENQDRLYDAIRWHVRSIIAAHDYLRGPNERTAERVGKPCTSNGCWQGKCVGPDCDCKCHITLNFTDVIVQALTPVTDEQIETQARSFANACSDEHLADAKMGFEQGAQWLRDCYERRAVRDA